MKQSFLTKYIEQLSKYPTWIKQIIYLSLEKDFVNLNNNSYLFILYKPILTYKGSIELNDKQLGFDSNIYNFLKYSREDCAIFDIVLNMYFSVEEVSKIFLFCVMEGLIEEPTDNEIMAIARFLSGKYRTGEYFVETGNLTQQQLDEVLEKKESLNKKIGQVMVDMGLLTDKLLQPVIKFKEEAKKRVFLDTENVPNLNQNYTNIKDEKDKQIEKLQEENSALKQKLDSLLSLMQKNR